MKFQFYFLSIFMLLTLRSEAQFGGFGGKSEPSIKGTINGEVVDSITGLPVGFATITLKKAGKDKLIDGVISEDNGKFKFKEVKNDAYDLFVSFLGYEAKKIGNVEVTLKDPTNNMEKILLAPASYVLDAVEVKGKRALIENQADKIVFNAEDDSSIAGGDATDVLRKVPMLSVDLDGNVSLRGSQNVRILINGKPSGMFSSNVADALKMFPADQIKKVEVISSPGAKYDGEGSAGIINIITKKENLEGIAGNVNASAGTRQNSLNLNVNAGRGRFGVSSGANIFYSVPTDANTTFLRTSSAGGVNSLYSQDGVTNTSRLGFNLSGSAFYDINAYNALNTSISYRGFGFDQNGMSMARLENFGSVDLDEFDRDNTTETLFSGYDWNTDYTRKFENHKDRELVFAVQYSGNIQNQDYAVQEIHLLNQFNRDEKILNDGDNRELTGQIDYVHPFPKSIKLETGVKTVQRNIDSKYTYDEFDSATNTYVNDALRSNLFEYEQDVYAGYGSLSFVISKINFITGLRYERTSINGNLQNNENYFESEYDNFLPSFTISKGLKNFRTIKLGYSKRIQRPSLYYINPFVNTSDNANIVVGNPQLSPEITHQFELGYNTSILGITVFANAYYKKTLDIIEQTLVIEDGVSLNSFNNVGENNSVGINLFLNKSIGRVTIRGGGDIYTYNASGTINGQQLENKALDYRLFSNGDIAITGDFKADFFGFFQSPRRSLQGNLASFWMYGLGLRKDFKNSSIGIRLIDPFNSSKNFRTKQTGANFSQESNFALPFRSFGINFRYKFGKVDFKERNSKIKNTDLKSGDGGNGGGNSGGNG